MRKQELESLDLSSAPSSHLHHEALDALEDQLGPLHTPSHRHLLCHLVGEEQGDGDCGHVIETGGLEDVPHTDDDRVS